MEHSPLENKPQMHEVKWTKENTSRMWRALFSDSATSRGFYPADFYRVALSELGGRLPKSGDCLDICCGTGTFIDVLASNGYKCSGTDIDGQSFPAIEKRFIGTGMQVTLRVGDIDALPFPDATFDAAFASEVIEHLDEAKINKGLSEILRVLKPGGFFAATTPNDEHLSPVVCPDCLARFHPVGHVQRIPPSRAAGWLVTAGFVNVVSRPFPTMFVYDHDPKWRGILKRVVRTILRPVLLRGRSANLIFSGYRPPR